MDDPWVKFFRLRYPQMKELVPILDSMTYLEELVGFPDNCTFPPPRFILLATATSDFVYDTTDGEDGLRISGDTLEEVYNGLKDWRWADSSEDPWDFVTKEKYVGHDFRQYYYIVKKTGTLAPGARVNTVVKSIPEKHDQDL